VPALAKALDVLELLSKSANGLTMIQIAETLGRSMGEIYRVVIFLAKRGYVEQDVSTGRYALTLQLFEMAHRHPPVNRLVRLALPILDALALQCEQSCHVGVLSHTNVLVMASSPSPRPAGYSVRAGAVFPLRDTSSGLVILAFMGEEFRERLAAGFPPGERQLMTERLKRIRKLGYEQRDSAMVHGIVNLCAPVFDHSGVVGAITMGFMGQVNPRVTVTEALNHVMASANELSIQLGGDIEAGGGRRGS
jgi:DNA-binding IclR family transcriptional regulator